MATHLERLSHPSINCHLPNPVSDTTRATSRATSSAVACDDRVATAAMMQSDKINESLSQVLGTSVSTTSSFYSTDMQVAQITTPTTPISPMTPIFPASSASMMDVVQVEMDNNTGNSKKVAARAETRHRDHEAKKSRSRASSKSQQATRSASSSTAGNSKRRSTHRQTTASSSTQPQSPIQSRASSIHMSPERRDQLLALHRDSCRLFQTATNTDPAAALAYAETRSPFDSPAASPILATQRSHSLPLGFSMDSDISDDDLLPPSPSSSSRYHRGLSPAKSHIAIFPESNIDTVLEKPEDLSHQHEHQQQQKPQSQPASTLPVVITEWTSPSTRRREYEKIDRSNRGMRRFWRRLTPSCFISEQNSRTPFFEEGNSKRNKKNDGGSVRRFRMDIPDVDDGDDGRDDGEHSAHGGNDTEDAHFQEKSVGKADGLLVTTTTRTTTTSGVKGRWSCFRPTD